MAERLLKPRKKKVMNKNSRIFIEPRSKKLWFESVHKNDLVKGRVMK